LVEEEEEKEESPKAVVRKSNRSDSELLSPPDGKSHRQKEKKEESLTEKKKEVEKIANKKDTPFNEIVSRFPYLIFTNKSAFSGPVTWEDRSDSAYNTKKWM